MKLNTVKMADTTKQVRVDNWAVFFLQRLQMFFSKTDYCDMTLQFDGNVQLKVHKLVINACTEYFQLLEQTCLIDDNIILMPSDLQADVIVPIINFMYTGMLEFQLSLYEKLYKTAQTMNITILTKLLEAQKSSVNTALKTGKKKQIDNVNQTITKPKTIQHVDLPAPLPGRKLPVWKRKSVPTTTTTPPTPSSSSTTTFTATFENKWNLPPDPLSVLDNTPKPTRFEWPDEELPNLPLMDTSFESISYTSKPLMTQEEETRASTSFDDIKQLPNASHTTLTKTKQSNTRSLDMEELKNYVKEQKIRSGLSTNDDIIDNDLDDYNSNDSNLSFNKRKLSETDKTYNKSTKKVRFNDNNLDNSKTTISVTTDVKTNRKLDHNKIVTEILKKYPQLVKENKNIRLKIMSKNQKEKDIDNKSGNMRVTRSARSKANDTGESSKNESKLPKKQKESASTTNDDMGPWVCARCSTPDESVEFVLYYLYRKHMTDIHNEKFDTRSCKYCGHYCSKHNLLIYHLYTKHGMRPPANYNFPKCNKCPFIAITQNILNRHKLRHGINEQQCVECKLAFTSHIALTSHIQITGHTGKTNKTNFDCQYCTKRCQSGINLFTHVRTQHRNEAIRDGIVSIDEDDEFDDSDDDDDDDDDEINDEQDEQNDEYILPEVVTSNQEKRVNILSNVKVTSASQPQQQQQQQQQQEQPQLSLEPSSEAEALNNVASGIATSLGLVDIVVLNDNQQLFLQTDEQQNNYENQQQQQQQQQQPQQQQQTEQTEFILPELSTTNRNETFHNQQQQHDQVLTTDGVITQTILSNNDIASTDELVMVLTDHDYGDNQEEITSDNSNIVVLYSHPVEGQQDQYITSQGNIMVNSRTGMIEIRNSGTITTTAADVTTTPTSVVATTPTTTTNQIVIDQPQEQQQQQQQQEESHIESIEMIQREIESHTNDNNTIEEKSKNDTQATDDNNQLQTSESQIVDDDDDVVVEDKTINDEGEAQNDTIEEIDDKSQHQDVEIKEESEQVIQVIETTTSSTSNVIVVEDEEKLDDVIEKSDNSQIIEEDGSNDNPTVNDQQSTEKDTDSIQEDQLQVENITENDDKQDITDQTNDDDIKEEKLEELKSIDTETEMKSDNVSEVQEDTATTQSNDNTELTNDENQTDTIEINTTTVESTSTSTSTTTATSASDGDVRKQSNSSMKIAILDDWDDTDSQQSDNKDDKKAVATGETVNKLMDDWEEEDEDDLKKETNE